MDYKDYEPVGDGVKARQYLFDKGMSVEEIDNAMKMPRLFINKVTLSVVSASEDFPRLWRKVT